MFIEFDAACSIVCLVHTMVYTACVMSSTFLLAELCLTSNVKADVTTSYELHHFKPWYELGHPVCICVSISVRIHGRSKY